MSTGKSSGLTPSQVRSGSRSWLCEVMVEFTVRAKLFRSLCRSFSHLVCRKTFEKVGERKGRGGLIERDGDKRVEGWRE